MPCLKVTAPSLERIEYDFGDVAVSIGCDPGNMIVLDDPLVSRYHAVVSHCDDEWWLCDQDSAHGVWVRGEAVHKHLLKDRECFTIGGHKFRFTLATPAPSAAPVSSSSKPARSRKRKCADADPRPARSHSLPAEAVLAEGPVLAEEPVLAEGPVPAEVPTQFSASPASSPEFLPPPARSTGDVPLLASASSAPPSPPPPLKDLAEPPIVEAVSHSANPGKRTLPRLLHPGVWIVLGLSLLAGVVVLLHSIIAAKDAPVAANSQHHSTPAPDALPEPASSSLPVMPMAAAAPSSPPVKSSPAEGGGMLPPPLGSAEPSPHGVTPVPPPKSTIKPLLEVVAADSPRPSSQPSVSSSMAAEQTDPPGHERLLFQPASGSPGNQPVLSPDLQHVLHLVQSADGTAGIGDLMLDQHCVRRELQIATLADLRFSADGSAWLAFAIDPHGQRALFLPDRSYPVHGHLQAVLGSHDFSVLAHVERRDGEDSLFLNGEKVSAYVHIATPRLSTAGDHWAYVAMKQVGADLSLSSPGERVVTDTWNGPVHHHITDLTLSRDGRHAAYVAHHSNGAQSLYVDQRILFEVKPYTGLQISPVVLAPDGSRCAWGVISREGDVEFHVDDAPSLPALVSASLAEPTIYSRDLPTVRVLFSADGRHVAFAAVGRRAIIAMDGSILASWPSALADSLTFSADGRRLAYIALHPLRPAVAAADGIVSQPHAAVLHVNEKNLRTAPISVHRLPGAFPITYGGIGQLQFSPDSRSIAYLLTPPDQGQDAESGAPRSELWINRRQADLKTTSVAAFQWLTSSSIRLVYRRDSSLWLNHLECNQ